MKISTALARGSKMIKPLAGTHLTPDRSAGCALGMIDIATGGGENVLSGVTSAVLRALSGVQVPHPCNCEGLAMGGGCHWRLIINPGFAYPLNSIIVHLFNYHVMTIRDWTMKGLIEWVASVEPPFLTDGPEFIAFDLYPTPSEPVPEVGTSVPKLGTPLQPEPEAELVTV